MGELATGVERTATSALSDAVFQGFEETAAEVGGVLTRHVDLGALKLQLRFAGPAMLPHIERAFTHRATPVLKNPDLIIDVFDGGGGLPWLHSLPWPKGARIALNQPYIVNSSGVHALFEPVLDHLYFVDANRGRGVYWVRDAAMTPYWESSFPARRIMHWWMDHRPLQPIHAGAVGFPDGGVLIAGKSGSGKSTTTLACLESNLGFAGDDYVLADHAAEPFVHNLYGTAKLEGRDISKFPKLEPMVSNPSRLDEEKALIFLNETWPERLSIGFPIKAIFVPEISGREKTSIRPAQPKDGFMAIAPTTLLHLRGGSQEASTKIAALTRSVPNYILEAGTDLSHIPQVIEQFLQVGGPQ